MTSHYAHAATAAQPSCPAPADDLPARAHRGPPGARSSLPRSLLRPLRRSRPPAHWPGPAASGTTVVLRDRSVVLIRQIQATDAPLVAGIFARLSPTSRWMRFLGAKNHLSDAELRYLTDIDHHDHEAVIALDPGGHGIGAARYIRHAHDRHAAEMAIAVVDDWHRRGLGTQLLAQLSAHARHEGVSRFTALTSADNEAIAGLLHTMDAVVTCRTASTVEYEITLRPAAAHHYQPAPRPG